MDIIQPNGIWSQWNCVLANENLMINEFSQMPFRVSIGWFTYNSIPFMAELGPWRAVDWPTILWTFTKKGDIDAGAPVKSSLSMCLVYGSYCRCLARMFQSFIVMFSRWTFGEFDGMLFITIMSPIASHTQNRLIHWKHFTIEAVPYCWTNSYLIAGYQYNIPIYWWIMEENGIKWLPLSLICLPNSTSRCVWSRSASHLSVD